MKTGMNLLLWTDHVTEARDVIDDQIIAQNQRAHLQPGHEARL
jgi:hypothetical protein